MHPAKWEFDPEEFAVIARLVADRKRFGEGIEMLYAYRGILLRWMLPRLGNAEDCADVAQDVYISIAKNCPYTRGTFSKALFFTIAERRVRDFLRRKLALKRRAQASAVPLEEAAAVRSPDSVTGIVMAMEEIRQSAL